jgi:hypothetical protein
MMRNRAERRKTTLYKLEALYRKVPIDNPLTEAQLQAAPPHFLEGEIDNVIFGSVPITTSYHSAERLRDSLQVAFSDKKMVMLLTHNIELLKATKLPPGEVSKYLKNIEGTNQTDVRDVVYERMRIVLTKFRDDIERAMKGEEPKCMDSHTDMAQWAMDFLVSMQRAIDSAEGDDADEDTDNSADPRDNRH